jgi:uncharacterized protein YbjT (DUF2867 family)
MEGKTALVFGATGLVGQSVVSQLCDLPAYSRIRIFVRRSTGLAVHPKIEEIITDFKDPDTIKNFVSGDDLFICLGTTIKKAGTVKKMEEIDRDLPVKIASMASENAVRALAIVSSLGASEKSSNYYLRIKGEMEKGILGLSFRIIVIARPSLLLGERAEKRAGESLSKFAMKAFGKLLAGSLVRYRAIEGADVATAMIRALSSLEGVNILESDKLQKIASE